MSHRRRYNQGARSLHCRGYDVERVGEKELRAAFAAFGNVVDVYLPKDFYTKRLRGFAYIQFERDEDADQAREKLDRSDVFGDNHIVNIMWAVGERKTPTDMRRLDIERDNPHARLERERQRDGDRERTGSFHRHRDRDRDRDRDWDRSRMDRDRSDRPRWERDRGDEAPWTRDRWERDSFRGRDRYEGRFGGRADDRVEGRFDDRDRDRERFDDRDRGRFDDHDRGRARLDHRDGDRFDDRYRDSGRGYGGHPGRRHSHSPPRHRGREDEIREKEDLDRPRDDWRVREKDDRDVPTRSFRKRTRSRSPSLDRGRVEFDKRRRTSRSRSPGRIRSRSPKDTEQGRVREPERNLAGYEGRSRIRGRQGGDLHSNHEPDPRDFPENGRDNSGHINDHGPSNVTSQTRSRQRGEVWPGSQPDADNTREGDEREAGENAPKLRSVMAPKLRSAPLSPVETTPESR